ncbi:MAG: hypothetical protein MUD02_05890 [Bacteroidales bacterium]|jgi:hypothetical protein|nr:hypothetical protein [Bacteroidales bacterium]
MKKSTEISAHILFWILFTLQVFSQARLFLEAKPDAPFGQSFVWVILLELTMGLIFFYTTFLAVPRARKSKGNLAALSAVLLILLLVFAWPAMQIGSVQVISSVAPHLQLILLAVIFRNSSVATKQ